LSLIPVELTHLMGSDVPGSSSPVTTRSSVTIHTIHVTFCVTASSPFTQNVQLFNSKSLHRRTANGDFHFGRCPLGPPLPSKRQPLDIGSLRTLPPRRRQHRHVLHHRRRSPSAFGLAAPLQDAWDGGDANFPRLCSPAYAGVDGAALNMRLFLHSLAVGETTTRRASRRGEPQATLRPSGPT
jgi:hypothetical protein